MKFKIFLTFFLLPVASVLLLFIAVETIGSLPPRWQKDEPRFNEIKDEVIKMWSAEQCATRLGSKRGQPQLVIACSGNYTRKDRDRFLDTMFRKGFTFQNEEFQFGRNNGTYAYTFTFKDSTGSTSTAYFRLFFRNASFLWKNPYIKPRVAIYLDGIADVNTLLRWQTLGIPLTYGLDPFRKDTGEIAHKIRNYGQELWLSLSLDPMEMTSDLGKILYLEDAIQLGLIKPYVQKALEKTGKVKGFSDRSGDPFLTNVMAVRTLFSTLKANEAHYVLDTQKVDESTAYMTAVIMAMKPYRAAVTIGDNCDSAEKLWSQMATPLKKDGAAIAVLNAENTECFKFLKKKVQNTSGKHYEYIFTSGIPAEY